MQRNTIFKRFGAAALALLLAVSFTLPARADWSVDYDVIVTIEDGLILRDGPGIRNDIVRSEPVPVGTQLHISRQEIATSGRWGQTEYVSNGRTYRGWIPLSGTARIDASTGEIVDNQSTEVSETQDPPQPDAPGPAESLPPVSEPEPTPAEPELSPAENGPSPETPEPSGAGGVSDSAEPASQPFDGVAYYGDPAACAMNAKTASAFADALGMESGSGSLYAALLDPANDGHPILLSGFFDSDGALTGAPSIRTDPNGEAYDFSHDAPWGSVTALSVDSIDGQPCLWADVTDPDAPRRSLGALVYRIENGTLTLAHMVYLAQDADGADLWTLDGASIDRGAIDSALGRSPVEPLAQWGVRRRFDTEVSRGGAMAEALRAYAEAYTEYPHLSTATGEEGWLAAVREVAAITLRSETTALYSLVDNMYYAIAESEQGIIMHAKRERGEIVLHVDALYEALPNEAEVLSFAIAAASAPNVAIDYKEVAALSDADGFIDYLRGRLDNMDGLTPNDAAKAEIAAAAEAFLSNLCPGVVEGSDNRVIIDADALGEAASVTLSAQGQIELFLRDSGLALNRPLVPAVRLLWRGVNWSQPCEIVFDRSLGSLLGGAEVRLLLDGAQYYVGFSGAHLRALTEEHGALTVRLTDNGSGYLIDFSAQDGQALARLGKPVTVGLGANGERSTIRFIGDGHVDNLGGRYDSVTRTLLFEAYRAGEYAVVNGQSNISDVSSCTAEAQEAIRIMAARGYMEASDGKFLPDAALTRYELTRALTLMLCAVDRGAVVSYPDVPVYSLYYVYVASSEALGLDCAASPEAFGGTQTLSTEAVLSLLADVLRVRGGYVVPEDAAPYLAFFEDAGDVSPGARSAVAMAVREGLLPRGGALAPRAELTRAQAAEFFARLLPLLYETPPVTLELPMPAARDVPLAPSGSTNIYGVIGVAATAALVLGAGGLAVWYLLVRKRYG